MKSSILIIAAALVAGCSPSGDEPRPTSPASTPPAAVDQTPAATVPPAADAGRASAQSMATASATGIVESIDLQAKTITIAHGPVPELKWPEMTMAFQAPDVDLSTIETGDDVRFEFTSTGMDGTITSIERR